MFPPWEADGCGCNGDPPISLLFHIIHHCITVIHITNMAGVAYNNMQSIIWAASRKKDRNGPSHWYDNELKINGEKIFWYDNDSGH